MRIALSAGISLIALLSNAAEARSYRAPIPLKGDPEAQVMQWVHANAGDLAIAKGANIDWIDFTEDGAPDALASFGVWHGGGDAFALFRNECGRLVFQQTLAAYGVNPEALRARDGVLRFTTTVPAPGDYSCCWTGRREWRVKLDQPLRNPQREMACGNSPRSLAERRADLRPFLESAPHLEAPAAAAVFRIYPRDMLLQWAPLPNAATYDVDIEYFDNSANAWLPEGDGASAVAETSYAFAFIGAQPGRWRVRAVDRLGNQSAFSEWRTFEHRN